MYKIIDLPNSKLHINHTFNVNNYHTVGIRIESGDFKGRCSFCWHSEYMEEIISSIKQLHSNLTGTLKIEDRDSDAFINIEMVNYGRLKIKGQTATHNDHYLRYTMSNDQTILLPLRSAFIEMLTVPSINHDKYFKTSENE
ncbi:hypothetical protein RI065_08510 [Mycoplasmatota bacterium zrk1]